MKEGKILIETAEKVNYISEYIVAYKAKIEALNKRGYLIQQLYMKFCTGDLQTVVWTEILKFKCSKIKFSIC